MSTYDKEQIESVAENSALMKAKLEALGYDVTQVSRTEALWRRWRRSIANSRTADRAKVIVYVSRHGCSIEGEQHVICADSTPYGFQVGRCKLPHVAKNN